MKQNQYGPPTDYRDSHLSRGGTYDETLASSPFDAYMMELERMHLQDIVRQLFPSDVPRYLDFACGTGRVTQTVSPMATESIGIDISQSMLEQARRKCPNVRFIQADLTIQEQDLGQFDLATSFRFFGNAQPALRREVLVTLSELIRPGGYLIINNHRNPNALAHLLHRMTGGTVDMDLTHSRFKQLLKLNGFLLEQTRPIGAWMFRSRMLAKVGMPCKKLLKRERLFGNSLFAAVAPDAILVARRRS